MSWAAVAVSAAGVILSYQSQQQQTAAQQSANATNAALTQAQIDEQAREYDIGRVDTATGQKISNEQSESRRSREDEINQQRQENFNQVRSENLDALNPYQTAGTSALSQYQDLLGLNGSEAQSAAYQTLNESPGQTFLRERQEKALLRNQAAIGGLGGGNVRTALQEQAMGFAQQDIENQYSRLSTLISSGLSASETQAGMATNPDYVITGADLGVSDTAATNVDQLTSEQQAEEEERKRKEAEEAAAAEEALKNNGSYTDRANGEGGSGSFGDSGESVGSSGSSTESGYT
jgi:hypothetical protein